MKFIAGLRVWVNGRLGKTPQVFPRFRGSANRRVDLHLPLIASIPGGRGRDIEGLAMPKAGTQTSSVHSGSGSPDWLGKRKGSALTCLALEPLANSKIQ